MTPNDPQKETSNILIMKWNVTTHKIIIFQLVLPRWKITIY